MGIVKAIGDRMRGWFGKTDERVPAPSGRRQTRMYAMGRPGRLTSGWGIQTTSEDTESATSLQTMRNRSRELVRDAAFAKRAKVIIQNNIIGSGIGMQAQVMTTRGELNEPVNDEIEAVWEEWMEAANCHMGQSLHFADIERMAVGEAFEAGEILIRMHRTRVGRSKVPLALEVIEPERIADHFMPGPVDGAVGIVRLGVEVDSYGAPLAYWIRRGHPGDLRLIPEDVARIERVPADDIIHLRAIDRWPQTRGTPWMHAVGRKFNDLDGLTEAEITAARGAACYMGFIEQDSESDGDFAGEDPETEDGEDPQLQLDPAMVAKLKPGQRFNFAAPNRPNNQLDPFVRLMLREIAAGGSVSYESLSRDYSQSNYSSSRLSLLDDRDLWKTLQLWFVRAVRCRIHRIWLQQAILSGAVRRIPVEAYALDLARYEAVQFKPRGWSWVDPTKEVAAAKEAIRAGFTTVSHVIAQTGDGRDLEDVLKERRRELDLMEQYGLEFDTDIENDPKLIAAEASAKQAAAGVKAAAQGASGQDPKQTDDGDGKDPEGDGEDQQDVADRLLREFRRGGVTI